MSTSISDLEVGSLANLIFNGADPVPPEYFQVEHIRAIYELYLEHFRKYNKTPTREQFSLLISQSMNGAAGITNTLATRVYSLEEEVVRNKEFYDDLVLNWKKCTVTSAKIEDLVQYIATKDGTKIDALVSSLYTKLTEFSTASKDTIFDPSEDYDVFSDDDFPFLYTGFNQIDQYGGIPVTSHVLINGQRGSGKTLLGFNILKNMYELNDVTTIFFSLEMTRPEVKARLLAMLSGISVNKILRKDLTDSEKLLIFREYAKFKFRKEHSVQIDNVFEQNHDHFISLVKSDRKELWKSLERSFKYRPNKFFIIDDPSIDVARISLIIDSTKKNYNLAAVAVDYLQIIRRSNPKLEAKDALGEISTEIRRIALTNKIVTILLGQLNLAGTMNAGSYSAEASPTLIWVTDSNEDDKEAGVMRLVCTKSRGAIPRTNLDLRVETECEVVYE